MNEMGELLLGIGKRIPIKTRIAVSFLFLTTLAVSACELVFEALGGFRGGDMGPGWPIVFALFYICPYVIPACLLLIRNKLTYIIALSMLILYFVFISFQIAKASAFPDYRVIYHAIWNVFVIVPLTLILLDIRNYLSATRSKNETSSF